MKKSILILVTLSLSLNMLAASAEEKKGLDMGFSYLF